MDDKCFYCGDTGYIHTDDDIPDQMCPNCEIGQAVIKGYNAAREIGIQACKTLEAAKDQRIEELEAGQLDFAKETTRIHKTKIQRIEELERPLKAAGFKVEGMLAVGNELSRQDMRIKELEIAKTIGIQACDLLKERIEELEAENEQLEKWQIKPTEAICLTDLACRHKKVFKNN